MKLVLTVFWTAFAITTAFNSEEFVAKHCVKNKFYESLHTKVDLYCSNVKFTPDELEEIQSKNFIISNEKRIIFEGGDLGAVNVNFLKKFPNTKEILFSKTSLKLVQEEVIDSQLPLETLYISESKVFGNNINLFSSLPKLSQLSLDFTDTVEHVLTKKFLGNCPNLSFVHILGSSFTKVDDDAFEDLPNLETLYLTSMNLTLLPESIKNLKRLKWVDFSHNKLTSFPKDVLPSTVEEISVSDNAISHISREDFKNFPLLKKLFLDGNGLEHLDVDTFNNLENLEELRLDNNKLSKISKINFEKLNNLKRLVLDKNMIDVESSDLRDCEIVSLKDQIRA